MAKIQAKFFTKQEQYSVPDHEVHILLSSDVEQLNKVVNGLLKRGEDEAEINFEFLLDGEFLRDSIEEHLRERDSLRTLKSDTRVEIEYVESAGPPTPSDSIMQDDWVMAVRASNGHILSGSYDNIVRVWTLSGQLVHAINGHTAVVKSVAWVQDGEDDAEKTFVSASHDGTARLWQWNQKTKAVECIGVYAVPVSSRATLSRSIDGVAVSPNKAMFATASQNYMVDIWSTEPSGGGDKPKKKRKTENPVLTSEVPQLSFEGHTDSVSAVCWMDNKTVCSASMDHTLRLWDVKKGVPKTTITGPTVFLDVQYSPLSHLIVTGSCDRNVRIYDPRTTGATLAKCSYTSHTLWVPCVYWSPVSEYHFISGSHDSVFKLWDTRSPKAPLYDMTGHEAKIFCCDWSVPEFMISGGEDKHIRLFRSSDNPTDD